MARIKIGHLRSKAIYQAKQAWMTYHHTGRKPAGLFHAEAEGDSISHWCYQVVIDGTEPLPYRQWLVELKNNGALICAYHQAIN